jgi:hypothetical protein
MSIDLLFFLANTLFSFKTKRNQARGAICYWCLAIAILESEREGGGTHVDEVTPFRTTKAGAYAPKLGKTHDNIFMMMEIFFHLIFYNSKYHVS